MSIFSKLFDFSTPDFDGINAKLDRLNEIEDATDYSDIPWGVDLTDEQARVGNELLQEKWQIFKELEGKVVCVDVVEEEERPWWKVW